MGTIVITRKRSFINVFIKCKIFIDDQNVGELSNGEVKEFKTTPGQHLVTINKESKGVSIELKENEQKKIDIISGKYSAIIFLAPFLVVLTVIFYEMSYLTLIILLSLIPIFNYVTRNHPKLVESK